VDKNTTKQDNIMDYIDFTIYFAISALAGAINSVAGGGTFLTFPFFILNGLSPLTANIMSTIALWPGAVASTYAYRSQLTLERAKLKEFVVVSMLGCLIGTILLLALPEKSFETAVPWLLLFATLLFTFGGRGIRWFHSLSATVGSRRHLLGLALQFAIAVYGGYFGAGQGILMLAMLQLLGMQHIHQMNAVKSLLGSSINAVAFIIFVMSGKVIWSLAPVMIAGAIVGGYFGSHGAQRVSPQKVRSFVSAIGFVMTAYFFLHGT
jgi:uncharacterized membrane protein YfcA